MGLFGNAGNHNRVHSAILMGAYGGGSLSCFPIDRQRKRPPSFGGLLAGLDSHSIAPVCTEKLNPGVVVMESAQDGNELMLPVR